MDRTKATARQAGLLYFLMSIVAVLSYFVLGPRFVVPGDATATAQRIMDATLLFRISILVDLVSQVLFIALVLRLYELFRGVDRGLAQLMVAFVLVGIAAGLADLTLRTAPLTFLSGAGFLSVFTKEQLDALSFGFLRLRGNGNQIVTMFWGLWLFPFGVLVIRSGFLPRLLGFLLLIAGVSYVVGSCTGIVFPEHSGVVARAMMPLEFCELPIIFWLLIVGAQVKSPEARAALAS